MAFTEEQRAAISEKGRVIVSASAGSGKTTVMIERLVRLIIGGADVKQVLAVTFTKKAAASMRDKLRSALMKKLSAPSEEILTEEEKNLSEEEKEKAVRQRKEHLKKQLAELPLADICTIHSFCGRLLRANFYLADAEADFKIISDDDAEGKEISGRAMDEALELSYAAGEEYFTRLLSAYFKRKQDGELREITLKLYKKYRALDGYRELLEHVGERDDFDCFVGVIMDEFRSKAKKIGDLAVELMRSFSDDKAAYRTAEDVFLAAERIVGAQTPEELQALLGKVNISRRPSSRKADGEKLRLYQKLALVVGEIKALYEETFLAADLETEREGYQNSRLLASCLAKFILLYDEIYTARKKEKKVLDYDDLEQGALALLKIPEVAQTVREKYRYLFVDEYQDVNPAQEKLVDLIGGEEIFLVGDKKQAIYAFRGSRSEYFTARMKSFEKVLPLNKNFRSAAGILDAVNAVFSKVMTEDLCGIDYLKEGRMQASERYFSHEGEVLVHRVQKEAREKADVRGIYSVPEDVAKRRQDGQAKLIASVIQSEIGRTWFDADEGIERTVGYRDIAVLVRDNLSATEAVLSELSERDIPVVTAAKVDIRSFWEIRALLDWLSLLDNAEQDVPLASAMLSSIGGFTEDDLAKIRLADKAAYYERNRGKSEEEKEEKHSFREACKLYAAEDEISEKLAKFYQTLSSYRTMATLKTAKEMICRLLADGLETEIAGKRDGTRRLARVRRLLEEAAGSVHEFLYRVERVGHQIKFTEAGGEDAVQVVTMHASKGLEYPVVIMGNLDDGMFSRRADEVMFHENFGILPKSYDYERKIVSDTIARRAATLLDKKEQIKGELNLLYVAMTRAKYRLHLVFGAEDKGLNLISPKCLENFFDREDFADDETPDPEEYAEGSISPKVAPVSEERVKEILSVYEKEYPYEKSVYLPVKSSATDLMSRELPPDFEYVRAEGAFGKTSPETGTAYHAFMQHVRFGEDAEQELVRMQKEGLLTKEQLSLLERDKLKKILTMPVISSLQGKRLLREQKFLLELPANQLMSTPSEDRIVYQGAIDLIAESAEGILLVDYKFSVLDEATLRAKYEKQIALYKKAISSVYCIREETVRAVIVNLLQCKEIPM